MKKHILSVSALLLACSLAWAETVHQSREGSSANKGDGSKAVASGVMETKTVAGVEMARVTAAMNQWGYVTYWMGLTTPPGAAVVRITVLNTGEPTASYGVYIVGGSKDPVGKITIPSDAAKDAPLNIDIPVNLPKEWSGITIKKFSADNLASPWIQSVSVVLPN